MNLSSAEPPDKKAIHIVLRPERSDDEAFLLALYASTREEELALTNWDVATSTRFIKMQFAAMRQSYASAFHQANFFIIMNGGNPVGRIVVHSADNEIRLVDLALLPTYRRQGIGGGLLQQLQAKARLTGKPLRLQVLKINQAARLYERLGFAQIGEDDFYRKMEWRPTTNV